jgi:hypothetical protein
MAPLKNAARSKKGHWITDEGEDVTPEVEERWATEIDAGFGIALWKRVRVGRPREDERLWGWLSFRISPEARMAAETKARRERRTLASLAAEAVRRYVES